MPNGRFLAFVERNSAVSFHTKVMQDLCLDRKLLHHRGIYDLSITTSFYEDLHVLLVVLVEYKSKSEGAGRFLYEEVKTIIANSNS